METIVKRDKKKVQSIQQVFHLMINIVEMYPQYSFAQHLAHVLRKKEDNEPSYFWADEKLLKKFEDYYDELKAELN